MIWKSRLRGLVVCLLVVLCLPAWSLAEETAKQSDARMAWWRDARFGMFIHWSLCSVPAGVHNGERIPGISEWSMSTAEIPVAEYAKYAAQFNPTKYDPDTWVSLAKQAGMKYIVQISKQHDGFAMFDTDATDFNVVDASPYKRDVIRPMVDACRKQGMPYGVYYSQAQDWHHPGGKTSRSGPNLPWDPAQVGDYDKYLDTIAIPQARELLTNYGDLAVFWWDTPLDTTPEQAARLRKLLALQPQIVSNGRLGGGVQGDFETPEQFIPATGFPGRDFETCMTMNDTWGYKSFDDNYKSTATLVRCLIDAASKGGNFLLNVGPTSDGVIPAPQVERLQEIGRWMAKNGDAIYGTTASVFPRYGFEGRATVKGNTLYIHVFEWPAGGVPLIGLATPVKSAKFLADGTTARFTTSTDDEGVPVVTLLPPADPDPIATVVALELDGPPKVQPHTIFVVPGDDGNLSMQPDSATILSEGGKAPQAKWQRISPWLGDKRGPDVDYIGNWESIAEYVEWPINVPAAGRYRVEVNYSSDDDRAGSEYLVAVGDSRVAGTVTGTGGQQNFRSDKLGEIELAAGKQLLTVKAVRMPHRKVMNLHQVLLLPME